MNNVKLGAIADFINGYAFKPSDWHSDGHKIIRIQNLTDIEKPYNRTNIEVPEKYEVKKGDILVSWSATLDVFEWKQDEIAFLNQHIFKVKHDKSKINKIYFKYALKHSIEDMLKYTHGSTMKHVVRKDFLNHQIPLPPLPEQKRIVAILDKADTLRRKRKEAIALLDELLRSVFLDMFGDPVTNPKGWEVRKVIETCDCIVPGRDKPKSFSGEIPWITTDDLNCLGWTSKSNKDLGLNEEEINNVRAKIIPKDSVIMTCVGDLGIVSIVKDQFVMNQQLHAFICSDKIVNTFLMFNLFFQKKYMYKMASSTTVPYMNKSVCNSIPILLPDINLQNSFAKIVQEARDVKSKMQQSLQEIDTQFNALMQRAFKGEL